MADKHRDLVCGDCCTLHVVTEKVDRTTCQTQVFRFHNGVFVPVGSPTPSTTEQVHKLQQVADSHGGSFSACPSGCDCKVNKTKPPKVKTSFEQLTELVSVSQTIYHLIRGTAKITDNSWCGACGRAKKNPPTHHPPQ